MTRQILQEPDLKKLEIKLMGYQYRVGLVFEKEKPTVQEMSNYYHQAISLTCIVSFLQSEKYKCFSRNNTQGHFTASAFVLSPDEKKILLTHHKKLNIWIQLGGHSDDCTDLLEVALQEVFEESGLSREQLTVLNEGKIFDVDIHVIPVHEKTQTPEHLHYDIRFLLKSNSWDIQISDESHDLKWVDIEELIKDNDESIAPLRIIPKINEILAKENERTKTS